MYFFYPRQYDCNPAGQTDESRKAAKMENMPKKINLCAHPRMMIKNEDMIERNLIKQPKFYKESSPPPLCFDIACVVNMESVSLFQRHHLKLSLKRMSSGGK